MSLVGLAALMFAAAPASGSATTPCPPGDGHVVFHAPPLFQHLYPGVILAVGVTFRASLQPRPSAQQVVLYRGDDGWWLSIDGYRWDREANLFETRRRTVPMLGDPLPLIEEAGRRRIAELAERDRYGNAPGLAPHEIRVCADGSTLAIGMAEDDSDGLRQVTRAERHSCSEDRAIDEIAAAFRAAALAADPGFAGFLDGLGRTDD